MNSPLLSEPDPHEGSQVEISDALILELGLSDLTVQKIYEVMASFNVNFVEAANRLGILRPETIEQALNSIKKRELPEDEGGIMETALRRIASDRRVVLRQGERVTPARR